MMSTKTDDQKRLEIAAALAAGGFVVDEESEVALTMARRKCRDLDSVA
jgi:hypothetical protein